MHILHFINDQTDRLRCKSRTIEPLCPVSSDPHLGHMCCSSVWIAVFAGRDASLREDDLLLIPALPNGLSSSRWKKQTLHRTHSHTHVTVSFLTAGATTESHWSDSDTFLLACSLSLYLSLSLCNLVCF